MTRRLHSGLHALLDGLRGLLEVLLAELRGRA
jgi:hypothetical protein